MWIHMKHTINSVFGWLYMYLLQTITLLLYKPDTCWSWWVSLLRDFSVCHFHGHFLLFHRKVSIENYLCKTDTSIRWTFLLVPRGVPLNRFQCMSFAGKTKLIEEIICMYSYQKINVVQNQITYISIFSIRCMASLYSR